MTKAERREKIEYLKRYRWLILDIESDLERIDNLNDRLYGIRASTVSDMPRGGRPITADTLIAEKVDLVREIPEKESIAEIMRSEIVESIESMRDPRDRTILKLKFIKGYTHEEIAEFIHYGLTQEREYYKRALENYVIPTHIDRQ